MGVRVTVAAVSGQRTSTIVHMRRPAPLTHRAADGPTGMPRRLWQFGIREQHGGVLQGMQFVRRLGNDQQVTVAFPFPPPRRPRPAAPDHATLPVASARVLVFDIEDPAVNAIRVWAKDMFVAAVDGPCAPAGRSSGCRLHQLTSKRPRATASMCLNAISKSRDRTTPPDPARSSRSRLGGRRGPGVVVAGPRPGRRAATTLTSAAYRVSRAPRYNQNSRPSTIANPHTPGWCGAGNGRAETHRPPAGLPGDPSDHRTSNQLGGRDLLGVSTETPAGTARR